MGFSSIRQGLMAALLASFLALFVLVPAVDAMSCGPEAGVSETAILLIDDHSGGVGAGGDADHAVCSHGHCHHGGVSTPARSAVSFDAVAARAPAYMRVESRLISHPPAGPERPPRT